VTVSKRMSRIAASALLCAATAAAGLGLHSLPTPGTLGSSHPMLAASSGIDGLAAKLPARLPASPHAAGRGFAKDSAQSAAAAAGWVWVQAPVLVTSLLLVSFGWILGYIRRSSRTRGQPLATSPSL
jgi:hypothetical protein